MRLPFDPSKMAQRPPADAPKAAPAPAPLTVSQLAERIGGALTTGFPAPVRVAGEISGFKPNAHWYFSIKDANAVVACVMFATQARTAGFTPADGEQVVVTGRPDYWGKGGRTSFIVTRVEPVGRGALDAAFRALCDELRRLGWFDADRKRPIPRFPRRIGLVTAATGAAVHDVLVTMQRRCPAVEVALVDVPVQGEGAAHEVAAAIRWLGREHRRLGIDVLLVTRGGGSREDLWTFNERVVAEAIVTCPIPVVAAIGHEVDVTVAELVADERAATPTQAAMKVTPDTPALLEQLSSLSSFLRGAVLRIAGDRSQRLASSRRHLRAIGAGRFRAAAHRLEELARRLEGQRPAAVHERRRALVASASQRLASAVRRRLAGVNLEGAAAELARAWAVRRARLDARAAALDRQLQAVGPMAVLRRGYSVTTRGDGAIVRSPSEVGPGSQVRTRVADGEFTSVVGGPPAAPPPPTRGKKAPGAPQMDLFGGPR